MHAPTRADVVICGAGIAGIAAAYHLAVHHGVRDVLLLDDRPPLSLTSDKSTECYRTFWPGPGDAMVALMSRSVDLLEGIVAASGGRVRMNRRGYVYATASAVQAESLAQAAHESSALGAGPVRVHTTSLAHYQPADPEAFDHQPDGFDLITGPALVRSQFPYLAPDTCAVLHARRAGWFGAQQLGMLLLEHARAHGARLIPARVTAVECAAGRVARVEARAADGPLAIHTSTFVNAAGPLLPHVARLLGVELPVYSELHTKVAIADQLRAVPRDAPMLIWADPQRLDWDADERAALAETGETRWMLERLPAGAHLRPEGPPDSPMVLLLWDYHGGPVEPQIPPVLPGEFYELALRGLSRMLPALGAYLGRAPRPAIDGGYYTRTRENRPLIGPLGVPGAYVMGAGSGFGLMAALAAGELLAAHITHTPLPAYAPAFVPTRYADPAYQALLATWGDTGQL